MNILKATSSDVLDTISKVIGIVPNKSTLPIVSNVLIRKTQNGHEFVGTDVEIEVRAKNELLGGDEGTFSTTLPAAKLMGLLKSLPTDQVVTLVANDANKVILKSGRSKFTLQAMNAQDFPEFKEETSVGGFTVSQKQLASLIDQVGYAMADGDVRAFLNGMFLEVKGGFLFAVATTGHRIAVTREKMVDTPDQSAIVPRKAVLELRKLLSLTDDPVAIRLSINHARFDFKGAEFLTRLISGKYVPYEKAIPKELAHSLMVSRVALLSILRRSTLVLNEKVKAVRFKFSQGLLTVVSQSGAEDGEQEIEVDYSADDMTLGLPVAQMVDGLANFPHDLVRLSFEEGKAMMMTYAEMPDFKYVVSPMRI